MWVILVAACVETQGQNETEGDFEAVAIVDNTKWQPTPASQDPWPEHRPVDFSCEEFFGWRVTPTGEVDVEMLDCGYLALQQPLGVDLAAGTELDVAMYHFDLAAPEAAQSHMALSFGDVVAWEKRVEIPGGGDFAPGRVFEERFVLESDVSAGTQVHLHMHNHGQNSYVFVFLRAWLPGGVSHEGEGQ